MKKILGALIKNPLIVGTVWITAGNAFTSFMNYLFNILMGRYLTTAEFGMYASLISLTIIISLPAGIIATLTTKLSADFFIKKQHAKLARLAQKLTSLTFIAGLLLALVLISFQGRISSFLDIQNSSYIYLAIAIVILGLVGSINRGLLQGLLYFKLISVLNSMSTVIKLVFGLILVSSGLRVTAALWAFFISGIVPWFISFIPLKNLFIKKETSSFGIRHRVLDLGFPSFSLNSAMMLFLSTDILLVKHYFSAEESGIFAAASIMGKVIFYITGPIVSLLLPIMSQRYAEAKGWGGDLTISVVMISVPSFLGVVFYYLFPNFVQQILFPNSGYENASIYISLYALYMFFFSISMLFANFFLAREKKAMVHIAVIAAILQIILIVLRHQSLYTVIINSIISTSLLTLVYVGYTLYIFRRNEKV